MPVDLTFEPLSTAKAAVTVIIGRQHNLAGMFEGATAVGSMNAALWRTMVEKALGRDVTVDVIAARDQGYGGLWGVGKAAAEPPALCVLSYVPAAAAKSVCLVGKGIVYDTGGLADQMVATGKHHAGIFTNDEATELAAVAAGKRTGDLVHPLPYAPEFHRAQFQSKVADFKNPRGSRNDALRVLRGQSSAEPPQGLRGRVAPRMGAATFVKRNPFAASPLAFAVEDCDFGDACEACGMGLFESVDTETFCSTFDATCSADRSEGTIECIESELCESSDDSAGDDHLAHCEADDACKGCAMGLFDTANTECIRTGSASRATTAPATTTWRTARSTTLRKGCAMGLFESTDPETFCSTLDTTCADCSAGNTECIKDGLCGSRATTAPATTTWRTARSTTRGKSCAMGLFESTDPETFCSTLDATCSDCSAGNTECIKDGLCESSDDSAGDDHLAHCEVDDRKTPVHQGRLCESGDDDDDDLAQCGFTDARKLWGLFESVEIETFCSTLETTWYAREHHRTSCIFRTSELVNAS
ncbi:manganese ion binding protein [Aureococcus anophagefferens]|nr:manganese ion binding protein [Aureococcus anophagefferens]